MKDFVADLSAMEAGQLLLLDSYQDHVAVIHMKGNGEEQKVYKDGPSRYNLIVFMLVERGSVEVRIDYKDYRMEASTFLHISPIHVVQNVILSPDVSLYLVVVTTDFLHDNRNPTEKPFPFEFILSSRHSPVTRVSEEYIPVLAARLRGLQSSIRRSDHMFQKILIKNDFSSFAFELGHIIHKQWKAHPVERNFTVKEEIMAKFMFLLINNCRKEHNVSFYADLLCISPEHLSRVLKDLSGFTANKWIARVLVTEAKILLKNPEIPIQQIADELGFSDQSSLSKFFRKNCGMSPLAYREEKRHY
ncbi:MAG: helix-turn-helix domain-containing protein [Bacteroides sp.]|nr:helix-turn-helix domain-containing protein [Bacteroides sp.]